LPLLSFGLTAAAMRLFYPLRGWNYRLYEHLLKHEWKLRALVVASSCYVALANGANNVANVVGPLAAAQVIDLRTGFLLMAPAFGIGAALFRAPAQTVGKAIVPIGLFSAVICNVVIGTILISASAAGIPQSLVQVSVASVLAVSLIKDGRYQIVRHRTIWRIFLLWLITPVIAATLTWGLLVLFT
jgi:phosphate/sulfate permease